MNLVVRIHHLQLASSFDARPILVSLRGKLRGALASTKRTMGFNITALERVRKSAQVAAMQVDEMGEIVASGFGSAAQK